MDVIEAGTLAERHFGGARLGDARRTRRLVTAAGQILRHPGGGLPQKVGGGWAETMGLYRLLAAPAVTHAAVLAPHRAAVLDRLRALPDDEAVLFLHDAAEMNFSHVAALGDQLGHVGSGRGTARGLVAHHTLAVTPGGAVLGLVNQILHRRDEVDPRETKAEKRARPNRESRLWLAGCDAAGPAPAGRCWVDVADRGADAFEFISHLRRNGRHFVIRSAKDRRLDGDDHVGSDRVHDHLHRYARDLPELGRRALAVSAQAGGKRKARVATVAVSAGPATIGPNRWTRGEHDGRPVDLWVVRVAEVDPPPGVEPLEWILLTDLDAATFAGACRAVDYYARRPVIEEFHKGLKTGLGVERLRLEGLDRLEPAVALLSVVAALLLALRDAARRADADATPATSIAPALWVRVLSGRVERRPRDDMSVREFLYGVARLGGHLGRRRDGPPGWLTLMRGWQDLQLMVAGAEAVQSRGGG
jgi:hypothetical protein